MPNKDLYHQLLVNIGENPSRDGLLKTPQRASQALDFLTQGYSQNIQDILNEAVFESDMDEMVLIKAIDFYSLCEHHLLPFFGRCHIAYIPKGKIIGLSKMARIVDVFAQRLQVQEQLTVQIAHAIFDNIQAEGVGVVVEAQHLCMMMRGVQKQNSVMTTSCMLGSFRSDQATRSEFLSLIAHSLHN